MFRNPTSRPFSSLNLNQNITGFERVLQPDKNIAGMFSNNERLLDELLIRRQESSNNSEDMDSTTKEMKESLKSNLEIDDDNDQSKNYSSSISHENVKNESRKCDAFESGESESNGRNELSLFNSTQNQKLLGNKKNYHDNSSLFVNHKPEFKRSSTDFNGVGKIRSVRTTDESARRSSCGGTIGVSVEPVDAIKLQKSELFFSEEPAMVSMQPSQDSLSYISKPTIKAQRTHSLASIKTAQPRNLSSQFHSSRAYLMLSDIAAENISNDDKILENKSLLSPKAESYYSSQELASSQSQAGLCDSKASAIIASQAAESINEQLPHPQLFSSYSTHEQQIPSPPTQRPTKTEKLVMHSQHFLQSPPISPPLPQKLSQKHHPSNACVPKASCPSLLNISSTQSTSYPQSTPNNTTFRNHCSPSPLMSTYKNTQQSCCCSPRFRSKIFNEGPLLTRSPRGSTTPPNLSPAKRKLSPWEGVTRQQPLPTVRRSPIENSRSLIVESSFRLNDHFNDRNSIMFNVDPQRRHKINIHQSMNPPPFSKLMGSTPHTENARGCDTLRNDCRKVKFNQDLLLDQKDFLSDFNYSKGPYHGQNNGTPSEKTHLMRNMSVSRPQSDLVSEITDSRVNGLKKTDASDSRLVDKPNHMDLHNFLFGCVDLLRPPRQESLRDAMKTEKKNGLCYPGMNIEYDEPTNRIAQCMDMLEMDMNNMKLQMEHDNAKWAASGSFVERLKQMNHLLDISEELLGKPASSEVPYDQYNSNRRYR
eukprot:GHVL01005441.1.p2 GENE.GHVL01005441.1~~GHVL01005441.1.p2  ORF type:complete len:762 (+),score=129.11 GHVL01005441.1:3951-6236(+)